MFLASPRVEAGLAEQRRLLVAEDAGDRACRRSRCPSPRRRPPRRSGSRAASTRGMPISSSARLVPVERLEVHQQRARRVGHVGRRAAAPPVRFHSTQRVHRPERQLAVLRALARAVDVVEDPLDLRARRSRSRAAARWPRAAGPPVVAASSRTMRVGARVLPDDRVVDRLAGLAVPDDRRLALVGDADRRDVARLEVASRPARRRSPRACAARPPSRRARPSPPCGVICSCSRWSTVTISPSLVEDDEARARRALVDRADVVRHARPFLPTTAASSLGASAGASRRTVASACRSAMPRWPEHATRSSTSSSSAAARPAPGRRWMRPRAGYRWRWWRRATSPPAPLALEQADPRRPALPRAEEFRARARGAARAGPAAQRAGAAPGHAGAVPAAADRALAARLHRRRARALRLARRPRGAAAPPAPDQARRAEDRPALKRDALVGAIQYYDAQGRRRPPHADRGPHRGVARRGGRCPTRASSASCARASG